MSTRRFVIVNRETGVYRGMIYDRAFAEKSIDVFREMWPGLDWVIEETREQFPVPGFIHIGEVRAARILKAMQYAKASKCAEAIADD
jgi:hypothetical protein